MNNKLDYLLIREMLHILKNQSNTDPKNIFKVFFGLYFLFGMHLDLPHVGGGGLYVPYNNFGWCTIGLLVGISFWYISSYGRLEFSKLQILAWIGFLMFLVPMYYPNNEFAYRATYRLMFVAGGLLLYGAFIQMRFKRSDKIHILTIILAAILIQSIIGMIQYYGVFQGSIRLFDKLVFPWGTFKQKNVMTTFMATGIGISLYLLSKNRGLFQSKLITALIFLIPLTGSIIIVAIKSKAGYLGLIATILPQLFVVNYQRKKIRLWFGILFTGLFIGWISPKTVAILMPETPSLYQRNIKDQKKTVNTRLVYYESSLKMLMDNKLFGVGYGRYTRELRNYLAKRRATQPDSDFRLDEFIDHPHSEILLWISEGGVVPLIGFIIIFLAYLAMIRKKKKQEILTSISLMAPITFHVIVELPFFISVPHWITFLFLISFIDEPSYAYKLSFRKIFLPLAVLLPAMVLYNMFNVYKNARLLTNYKALSIYKGVNEYELLLQIKKPGPMYLVYEYEILKSMLDLGLKSKNKELLETVVEKAKYFVQHSPIISAYEIRVIALKALGREYQAMALEYNARYLYPDPTEGTEWLYLKDDQLENEIEKNKIKDNLRIAEDFLKMNKIDNSDIVETESGLQYRIIKNGEGQKPSPSDKIMVHYNGRFIDGSEFDSSIKGGEPAEFQLGHVIKGWTEGIQLMQEGARFEFFIHPRLGYGERNTRKVPANSCLIFDVELIKIIKG